MHLRLGFAGVRRGSGMLSMAKIANWERARRDERLEPIDPLP